MNYNGLKVAVIHRIMNIKRMQNFSGGNMLCGIYNGA